MGKLVVAAVIALATTTGQIRGGKAVPDAKQPWFQLKVDEHGGPAFVYPPDLNRAQREFLCQIRRMATDLGHIDEIERELAGAMSGVPKKGGYGFSYGGAFGFDFELDGRAIVWFEYDSEAEGDDRYPVPARELEVPLSDFAELFRAWAASVRHWRSLGGYSDTPPPPERWPASYPPRRDV